MSLYTDDFGILLIQVSVTRSNDGMESPIILSALDPFVITKLRIAVGNFVSPIIGTVLRVRIDVGAPSLGFGVGHVYYTDDRPNLLTCWNRTNMAALADSSIETMNSPTQHAVSGSRAPILASTSDLFPLTQSARICSQSSSMFSMILIRMTGQIFCREGAAATEADKL